MAEIQAGPSEAVALPVPAPMQGGGAKSASGGDGIFAGVLSGRVAAMQKAKTEGAQGISLADFAGKSHLIGLPGLFIAGEAGVPAAGTAGGLDAALLAAFMGGNAGMPLDPALMNAVTAQLASGQGNLAGQSLVEAADVAGDGKELPVAIAGLGRKVAAGAQGQLANLASDGRQAAEPADVDTGLKDGLKGGRFGQAEEVLDLKAVDVPLKAAAMAGDALPVTATSKPGMSADALALAGLTQAKGAPSAVPQEALVVRTPMQAAAWGADFSQKVIWLAGRESHAAQIVLNPPHLGAVEVRLTMNGSEAGAQFFSPHQGVREAIEAAIPRLREMMAEAGLSLGQASVSPESFRDSRGNAEHAGRSGGEGGDGQADEAGLLASEGLVRARVSQGLVDLYV